MMLGDMVCLGRQYHFKFFKGCLAQILFGPFLNNLTHMIVKRVSIFLTSLNAIAELWRYHTKLFHIKKKITKHLKRISSAFPDMRHYQKRYDYISLQAAT